MNKKLKLYLILTISGVMLALWFAIYITGTQGQQINYWWQLFMGLTALMYGCFGILTAQKWGWLKSGVGRGIFFLSLGLVMWSIGQLGWTYFLFAEPDVETPQSHLLDIIDFSAIPVWFYGLLTLSKATGAKYGLRKTSGKILTVLVVLIMTVLSFYFLVDVARGGTAYFEQTFWKQFFDLGYSIGDAIILTAAIVIVGLSWKLLGGRFRLPIITIVVAFAFLYLADFWFSYRDGQGVYYNGDMVDLFYFLMITTLTLGITMLDPSHIRAKKIAHEQATQAPQEDIAMNPSVNNDADTTEASDTTPDFLKVNPVAPYAAPHDNSEPKKDEQ